LKAALEETKTGDSDFLQDDLGGLSRSKCEIQGETMYFDSIFEDHDHEGKEDYKQISHDTLLILDTLKYNENDDEVDHESNIDALY